MAANTPTAQEIAAAQALALQMLTSHAGQGGPALAQFGPGGYGSLPSLAPPPGGIPWGGIRAGAPPPKAAPKAAVLPPPPASDAAPPAAVSQSLAGQPGQGLLPPDAPGAARRALLMSGFADTFCADVDPDILTQCFFALGFPPDHVGTVREVLACPFERMSRVLEDAGISTYASGKFLGPVQDAAEQLQRLTPPPVVAQPAPLDVGRPVPVTMAPEDPGLLQFSKVLHPASGGHFTLLSDERLTEARDHYVSIKRREPRDAARPAEMQLSALHAWITTAPGGRYRAPRVCFGLWAPHFDVEYENAAFAPQVRSADGAWRPTRGHGPMSFRAWSRHWAVFEAAMISLGHATPEGLEDYRRGIEKLAERFDTEDD